MTTLHGLRELLSPEALTQLLLLPPGPALDFARGEQLSAAVFANRWQLLRQMASFIWQHKQVCVISTSVSHAVFGVLLAWLKTFLLGRGTGAAIRHLHVVHGGTDEALSYGRKKYLRWFAVEFIAVSSYVRQRLQAHHVPAARIHVIENCLPPAFVETCPQHPPYSQETAQKIEQVICVSRLDPIKRVGLLLDALQLLANGEFAPLRYSVYGRGWQEAALRERAAQAALPIEFIGFSTEIEQHMACADLLVHTCPEEPFGLVVLEAMAARIPVLVADQGGPASFIHDGVNGFTYRANDCFDLARKLREIQQLPSEQLQRIVDAASDGLQQRFSGLARSADYLSLITRQAIPAATPTGCRTGEKIQHEASQSPLSPCDGVAKHICAQNSVNPHTVASRPSWERGGKEGAVVDN